MKTKILSSIFIFFLGINCLHGQTINYTYDENGNRISRTLEVQRMNSRSLNIPVQDLISQTTEEQMKEKVSIQMEGELNTIVYPNPTKGLIKIDISYMPLNSKTEARVYNMLGTEVMVQKNFDNYYEMDISKLKDGIYILRIKINDKIFDWKVIKKN